MAVNGLKIIDLRTPDVRLATACWERSDPHPTPALAAWNRAAQAWIDRRVRHRPPPAPVPYVVSVGNLALGGTGKTPVAAALARDLASAGLRVAVVTRGYRSAKGGPLVVDPQDAGAGDEARWMAGQLQGMGCPVIQARNRAAGVAFARALRPAPDVVILEDGHQSAGVGRHLDILILDGWAPAQGEGHHCIRPRTGDVLPWGPWREGERGAQRADIWLVETAEPLPAAGCWGNRTATFVRSSRLVCAQAADPVAVRGRPWAALSGIARPGPFVSEAGRLMGRPADLAIRLADHQRYDRALAERILGAFRRSGAACLVTTDKDWIKLQGLWPASLPVVRVVQDLAWGHAEALPALVRERWQEHREQAAGGR